MNNILWTSGHTLKFDNIVGSDNCYIYDSLGNMMIDLESGVWCTSIGHNNKRLNNVITDQMNKIAHTGFCYCHPAIAETANKVLQINGMQGGKCEFLCSGSEAVEFGMRVARTLSDKPLALTFSDSYFGAYGDAAAKSPSGWYIYDWLGCGCSSDGRGCAGRCDTFDGIPFDKIGIFLFEPGSSSGLVRFPPGELIAGIAERIRENDGIVMANEITTGIGRTGQWFGYQHYGIRPDIVAMGKGIGNGYPVSVTAVSQHVAERLASCRFHYAQSHQNDPLGAIVAGEVISVITEGDLVTRAAATGEYLLGELMKLKSEHPVISDVRGRGLMIAIEFTENAAIMWEELAARGFIVAKRPNAEVLRLDPALTVEESILVSFVEAFSEILRIHEIRY